MPNIDKNYKSKASAAKNRRDFNYVTANQKTVARYWLAFCVAATFIGMIIVGML